MKYCTNCGAEVTGSFCSECGTKVKAPPTTQAVKLKEKTEKNDVLESYDKDALLNILYTLRAGISHISLKCDEARKEEKKNNEIEAAVRGITEQNSDLRKKQMKFQRKAATAISDEQYKSRQKEYETEYWKAEKADTRFNVIHKISLVFLILFGLAAVVLIGPALSGWQYSKKISPGACLFLGVAVIAIVSLIVFLTTKEGDSRYAVSKKFDEYKKKYKEGREARLDVSLWRSQVEKNQGKIAELRKSNNSPKIIKALSKESEKLYNAMVNAFGGVLNPQDWKNIDTIIYCLETHRASDLKEALQQTDLVVRHEEIKSVMINVGNKICATIAACTMQLSMQLGEISDNQRTIAAQLKNINDNILSSAEMQNALLAKANENSKKLMEDVHKMRDYADIYAKQNNLTL